MYSLKRKFRNPLNAVPEKGRPEKEVVDGKKKEKDEIKKNGARVRSFVVHSTWKM